MKKIDIEQLQMNPFTKIGKEWFLVGAKNTDGKFNAMTASWGGLGVLWSKNVANVYVRPQRYTKEFIEDSEYMSICFFDEKYRKELSVYGAKSGRDINKEETCGFHLVNYGNTTYIQEASTVFICRKLYRDMIKAECMIDETINESKYPNNDHHIMYVVEIVEVLVKE